MSLSPLVLTAFLLILNPLIAQNGPSGVGSAANMKLWLRADNGVATTGTAVNTWSDGSGNNHHAAFQAGQPTTRPTLVAGSANGYPTLDFDGANDQLVVPHHSSLSMDEWDIFMVG